ncbi:MAG: putative thiosulfate sulfurtransferase [Methanosaeta sp. PtaU1.Bin112]|nr:MAG: putative thiosulfate sulfurtransferase [Methanosaeta sp. PtaU1.Bin112]
MDFASGLASVFIILLALMLPALAGTENCEFCPTCPDWSNLDGWLAKKAAYEQEQKQKTVIQNQDTVLKIQNVKLGLATDKDGSASSNTSKTRTGSFAEALASPVDVLPGDVVLDISPNATRYIEGAININYEVLLDKVGELRPVSEIAELLGDAGVSSNDSLVIAGECLPCGGGPSPAIFAYWVLKYLGQKKVGVLDGSIDDWAAAGLNTSNSSATRPKTNYIPQIKPELLATYDFVINGDAQIVDARPARDFEIRSIPGAVNIPYGNVVVNERIRPEEDLQRVFAELDINRPVVVYTNLGFEASLVWFALTVCGYDARLYSLLDYIERQPKFGFGLIDSDANPNPVRSGSTTTIMVSFQKSQAGTSANHSDDEIKLTVKEGCVTCGWAGFSMGIPGISGKTSGTVQLGSSATASPAGGDAVQDDDGTLHCTAVIKGSDGSETARTSLLQTAGYKFMGLWNADVVPGIYRVSIVANVSGLSETFADVLDVEVIDKS